MKNNLKMDQESFAPLNNYFLKSPNPVVDKVIAIIDKFGGVQAINQNIADASKLENKMAILRGIQSPYLKDLIWLQEQIAMKAFIPFDRYVDKVIPEGAAGADLKDEYAVTLEISALQYFPWLIVQAQHAIKNGELMPGRFIRVRNMKEQESDNGDLIAVSAAMDILGASWVETLDTKGTDGANVHLGGPDTITGYFGGPGQPNDYPLKWVEEYLYYATKFGVRQVLNVNPGTVLLGYILYRLGVEIQFKISVFMGNDNPYSVLWTLMTAKMFSRPDGTTPLVGFNFSNSVNNETILHCADIRRELGFEDKVRFEHHITETYKHIVRQPYDRTEELTEVAQKVKNISAKHEGGVPDLDQSRSHPSDILDYFMAKKDIEEAGLMKDMLQNYLDKHAALNRTAASLLQKGIPVIAAQNIHK